MGESLVKESGPGCHWLLHIENQKNGGGKDKNDWIGSNAFTTLRVSSASKKDWILGLRDGAVVLTPNKAAPALLGSVSQFVRSIDGP